MTLVQLLERIIADGIAEVRLAYADPKDHHKRDGAIEGFEACRGKSPDELVELWHTEEKRAHEIARAEDGGDLTAYGKPAYWKQRYKALQIEWVCNVISVGLEPPLLPHLPTYRGAMKYAEIVGVGGTAPAMG